MPTPLPSPFPVDVLDNWVDYLTLIVAVLSLLATGIGAFLIWRQIRQTGQALRFANDEQETNRQLLLDSRRSRIDDEMPKLLVWIARQTSYASDMEGPPREAVYDSLGNEMLRVNDPLQFRVFDVDNPTDMATEIDVNLEVTISNDGPRGGGSTRVADVLSEVVNLD